MDGLQNGDSQLPIILASGESSVLFWHVCVSVYKYVYVYVCVSKVVT